jgi:hypothetical protein
MEKYPQVGKLYDHYKGGRYEVITLAPHTETGEILVICKSVHFGTVCARPLSVWNETVTIGEREFPRYSISLG